MPETQQAAPTAPLDRLSPWLWDVTDSEWSIGLGLVCVVIWALVMIR